MKKFLTLALALTLAIGMLCLPAAAAAVVGNGTGTSTNSGAVTDGVESFTDVTNNSTVVSMKVNNSGISNRYAVDLVVPAGATLQLNGGYVWNVDTLKYEVANPDSIGINGTTQYAFTVTNYSDLPVYAKGDIAVDSTADAAGVNFAFDATGWQTVASAAPTTDIYTATGKEVEKVLTATVGLDENGKWSDVLNALVAAGKTEFTLGTVTITISATDPNAAT